MSLTSGSRLGSYEVLSPLGAGGMGEVWKARDTKLGREVAIKILPAGVSDDRDRLARFEQEARAASSLNHPNIVTIYEIGQADSISYISMELVQGKTLRDLLADGALPPRRLLALSSQMAEGLARAHEAGIVHRDLKPENLMVTREGLVKILDFGLAKLAEAPGSDLSQLATTGEPTRPGVVLGTVAYMSPEQATGRPVDFRSDQFSLGSILYEMAAGRRAFARSSAAETMTAIIREEPEPLQSVAPQVPVAVRWVTERCLAKEPEERYASTRDLARDLAHLRDHVSEVSQGVSPVARPRRRRGFLLATAAGILLAAALGLVAGRRLRPQAPAARAVKFSIPIPRGATYKPSEVSRAITISPDGTRLVIEAISRGHRRLYLRRLDSEDAVELEGSLDASAPFWSPDGRFLAFYAEGKLKKIPAEGGTPVELCDAPFAIVGTWNREGTILFTKIFPAGIYSVSDRGGESALVAAPDAARREGNVLWPHFLPDGRRFLYIANLAQGSGAGREVRLASLDSKGSRSLGQVSSRVEYAAPGYLVYVREGALFAQPFDERRGRMEGEPRLLAANAHHFYGPSHAAFSVSQTGALVYQTAPAQSRLAWFDRGGKETGQLGQPAVTKGLRISPDGTKAAVDIEDRRTGTSDIWVFELGSGAATRLHSDPVDEIMPLWSPDGAKVLYRSDRTGPPDVYEIAIAVPGSEKPVLQAPGVQQPEDVSRDGRLLAYLNEVESTVWNIWLLPLGGVRGTPRSPSTDNSETLLVGDRKPFPWQPTRFNQTSPRFSPDGRWIAYESDESGDSEIYGALTEGGGEKRRLSAAGGQRPRWRRDGKELYYIAPGGFVMALPVTLGSHLEAGAPVPLFRVDSEIENYDAAADGSRFLVSMPSEKVRESPIRVIVNWPAALEKER